QPRPAVSRRGEWAAATGCQGMLADRRVKSCNVASAVSMACVVTNTSRDACAMGAGHVAAKTGETKTGETRIAVAANIRPMGLGIVRVPRSLQVTKFASRQECKGEASIGVTGARAAIASPHIGPLQRLPRTTKTT